MYDTSISKICIILSIVYHIYIYIKIINIILLNFEYWDIFFILKNDKNLDFPKIKINTTVLKKMFLINS